MYARTKLPRAVSLVWKKRNVWWGFGFCDCSSDGLISMAFVGRAVRKRGIYLALFEGIWDDHRRLIGLVYRIVHQK